MTEPIKTIRSPRLLLLSCEEAEKTAELIAGILQKCSYSVCIGSLSENTDFMIITDTAEIPQGVSAEMVLFDGSREISESVIELFHQKVSSYEYACRRYGSDFGEMKTYSENHYSADVTCRNVDGTDFDIIHEGILGRVRMKNHVCTVQNVLLCTAALTAAGIPLASVIEYFNRE